jgi:hypothetical protein
MNMTPRELELTYDGYRKRKKEEWEMIRYQAFYSVRPHISKDSQFNLSDIKLPIDEPIKITKDMLVKVRKING